MRLSERKHKEVEGRLDIYKDMYKEERKKNTKVNVKTQSISLNDQLHKPSPKARVFQPSA